MKRRDVFKYLSLAGLLPLSGKATASVFAAAEPTNHREYWVHVLTTISSPLLESLSKGELKKNMPVECKPGMKANREEVTYLEAFGRLMAGLAPWLELGADNSKEGKQRKHFIELAQKSLKMAVDPKSPDFMNFTKGYQPLVDAAFLAHAILRAPNVLWKQLDQTTKRQLVEAMKSSREITPWYNNWLLFSGMVEAFLAFAGEDWDQMRVDLTIKKHMEWYVGDGMYGDGPQFHWDYYNSYVIQPMMVDILKEVVKHRKRYEKTYEIVMKRATRYAAIQEKLISPEGTFPAIGRSLPYRFGAFQHLSQMALQHHLPESVKPAQVRCALTAVIERMFEADGVFDSNGWLKIGFVGHQPDIAESYISTGSLYLCSVGLLALGLPENDPFWADPATDWTAKTIWGGTNYPADHALKD
ncbi:DUF2264 domain-containing protein [Sunxiuqinia elliptica]|uniref:DUF2264 domain-containing protein n=1 Tax=Sunxiuqinia elliptica TaxID=655355 RepID=A0A1I2HNF5_9BACT|nr:DUF2264 domain-containing protein [Sunxiuqinia elliptica]SFF30830.1 hypothetical protein SAMN05216283_104160 [Sunxiuqinia elliptica]